MADLKNCTSFGRKIKIALIEQNMTSQELAKKLGYTNSTICDVVFGRNRSVKTRHRIANALGLED